MTLKNANVPVNQNFSSSDAHSLQA